MKIWWRKLQLAAVGFSHGPVNSELPASTINHHKFPKMQALVQVHR